MKSTTNGNHLYLGCSTSTQLGATHSLGYSPRVCKLHRCVQVAPPGPPLPQHQQPFPAMTACAAHLQHGQPSFLFCYMHAAQAPHSPSLTCKQHRHSYPIPLCCHASRTGNRSRRNLATVVEATWEGGVTARWEPEGCI